jgi:hypothetical protein
MSRKKYRMKKPGASRNYPVSELATVVVVEWAPRTSDKFVAIAIYPVGGWGKEKKYLERYNSLVYYSLIVSIRVSEVEVDLYTQVSNLVSTLILIFI